MFRCVLIGLAVGIAVKGALYFAWGVVLASLVGPTFWLIRRGLAARDANLALGLFDDLGGFLLVGMAAFTAGGVLVGAYSGVRRGLEAAKEGRSPAGHVAAKCFRGFFKA